MSPSARTAVGVDAVAIARLRRALERRPGLERRLFTVAEREHAARRADPVPSLAARFAAKEATMKLLTEGIGRLRFSDIEVEAAGASSPPRLRLTGAAAALAEAKGLDATSLSMTHTEDLAFAVVVGTCA